MKKYLLLFVICSFVYIARFVYSGHGIYGDGNGYWSYAHTLYFQHNLDFRNIYDHLEHFKVHGKPVNRLFWNTTPTSTGSLPNHWLIGTGLLWIPSLFILDMVTKLAGLSVSPYNVLWELGPGITGVFLGVAGCFFVEKILRSFWNSKVAVSTVFILVGCTNLAYYIAIEPALSHSAIFFVNALFVFIWLKANPRAHRTWVVWGVLAGLSAIIRITGVFIIFLPLYTLVSMFYKKHVSRRRILAFFALFSTFFIAALTPQLISQQIIYGSIFHQQYAVFYTQQQSVSIWWLPESLFSAQRGLFFWHPAFLIAVAGLVLRSGKDKKALLFCLYPLGILLAIGFWGGALSAGFGNRFFLEALPFFAVGTAYSIERLGARKTLFLYLSLSVWNLLLAIQFFADKPRLVDQKGLNYINFITGQITIPLRITQLLLKKLMLQ